MDPNAVPFGNFEETTQRKKYVIRMKTVTLDFIRGLTESYSKVVLFKHFLNKTTLEYDSVKPLIKSMYLNKTRITNRHSRSSQTIQIFYSIII